MTEHSESIVVELIKERSSRTGDPKMDVLLIPRKKFGQLLVDNGFVSLEQRDISVKIQKLIRETLKRQGTAVDISEPGPKQIQLAADIRKILSREPFLIRECDIPADIKEEFTSFVWQLRKKISASEPFDFQIGSIIASVYGTDRESINKFNRISIKKEVLLHVIHTLNIRGFKGLMESGIIALILEKSTKKGKKTLFALKFGIGIYPFPLNYYIEVEDTKWDMFQLSNIRIKIGNIDNLIAWIADLIKGLNEGHN